MKLLLPIATLLLTSIGPVQAQNQSASWVEQKCRAYQGAWEQAIAVADATQVNYAFIAANENFIASGCIDPVEACPRSSVELDIANALTLAMMNTGTASTFLPFRCPAAPTQGGGWSGPGL